MYQFLLTSRVIQHTHNYPKPRKPATQQKRLVVVERSKGFPLLPLLRQS